MNDVKSRAPTSAQEEIERLVEFACQLGISSLEELAETLADPELRRRVMRVALSSPFNAQPTDPDELEN